MKQELQTGHAGLTFSGKKKREEKTFSRSHKIWIGVCYPRSYTVKILPYFKGEMNKNWYSAQGQNQKNEIQGKNEN